MGRLSGSLVHFHHLCEGVNEAELSGLRVFKFFTCRKIGWHGGGRLVLRSEVEKEPVAQVSTGPGAVEI